MRIPPIDPFSFSLGFGTALVLFLVLYWFRRPIGDGLKVIQERIQTFRERLTSGTEFALREDTLRYAQTAHIAGNIFALNEILMTPRLFSPDPGFDPTLPPPDADITSIIPVLPEWPDLSAIYRAETLSIEEAFKDSDKVMILGVPGIGKSTLLAHLASRASQDDEELFPGGVTPLFVHAADLDLPRAEKDDLAHPLIAAAQARASALTSAQLPRHLDLRIKKFKCAIFLDGLDEMPPAQIAEVSRWVDEFSTQYPHHRWFAAAGPWGYGPLLNLGFAPIVMAGWNAEDYRLLIKKWGTEWEKLVKTRGKKSKAAMPDMDMELILGWIANNNQGRSVLEVTLRVWSALAGDAQGNRPIDWMATYIQRLNLKPDAVKAVLLIAGQLLGREDALGAPRTELTAILDKLFLGPDGKPHTDSDDFLDELIKKKVLAKHAKNRLAFQYGLVNAYCAAQALALDPQSATPNAASPAWVRALAFFGTMGDLIPFVQRQLTQTADFMQSELLTCAQWLRDSRDNPTAAKWRGEIYKRLAQLMLNPNLPEAMRLRALAGFISSYDPAVVNLFKQALGNGDPFNRRMAALGLGAIGEVTAIPQLAAMLNDSYLDVRWAAALALAVIGNDQAINSLAQGLLEGDDHVRQAAAQALARNIEQGHPLLQEAAEHPDLGTRRAAVYGLAAVHKEWAFKQLEKMQTAEKEWLVRNAATEMVEKLKAPSEVHTPKPYAQPDAQGWLIAWAAKQGTGVPPGRAAIEILNRALREGDEANQRAAAQSLGRLADPAVTRELYGALRVPNPLVRDAAFRALVQIAQSTGQRLVAGGEPGKTQP